MRLRCTAAAATADVMLLTAVAQHELKLSAPNLLHVSPAIASYVHACTGCGFLLLLQTSLANTIYS